MNQLYSISSISKVFDTGSKPVLIMGNDLNDYVCKHANGRHFNKLIYDFIISSFVRIWQIPCPESVLLQVKPEHVPGKFNNIQPVFFRIPSLGSFYIEHAKEVDHSVMGLSGDYLEKQKVINKQDLLKIALFDLWVANEDRNFNNYNLLLNPKNEGYEITAIDHECGFNTRNLDKQLSHLTLDETLISSDFIRVMFHKSKELTETTHKIAESYYLCVDNCLAQIDNILDQIPEEWDHNKQVLLEQLENSIFTKTWIKDSEKVFREYLKLTFYK